MVSKLWFLLVFTSHAASPKFCSDLLALRFGDEALATMAGAPGLLECLGTIETDRANNLAARERSREAIERAAQDLERIPVGGYGRIWSKTGLGFTKAQKDYARARRVRRDEKRALARAEIEAIDLLRRLQRFVREDIGRLDARATRLVDTLWAVESLGQDIAEVRASLDGVWNRVRSMRREESHWRFSQNLNTVALSSLQGEGINRDLRSLDRRLEEIQRRAMNLGAPVRWPALGEVPVTLLASFPTSAPSKLEDSLGQQDGALGEISSALIRLAAELREVGSGLERSFDNLVASLTAANPI